MIGNGGIADPQTLTFKILNVRHPVQDAAADLDVFGADSFAAPLFESFGGKLPAPAQLVCGDIMIHDENLFAVALWFSLGRIRNA